MKRQALIKSTSSFQSGLSLLQVTHSQHLLLLWEPDLSGQILQNRILVWWWGHPRGLKRSHCQTVALSSLPVSTLEKVSTTWKITPNGISAAGFKSMLVATAAGDLQVDRLREQIGIADYPQHYNFIRHLRKKQLFCWKCKNITELGQNDSTYR